MRVLIDIMHPAHVHFFRHYIEEMANRGHHVKVLSRKKDVALPLLDAFGIDHEVLSEQHPGRISLAMELAERVFKTRAVIKRFKPDLIMGLMGPAIAIAGRLENVHTVVFYDNETTHRTNRVVSTLVDAWISPRSFKYQYGAKHLRYNGYHELAYLHPKRFSPDAKRVRAHGVDPGQPYSLLRFVAWESIHDDGETGLSRAGKMEAVTCLSKLGPVYITSEKSLPAEFERYRLSMPVEDIHHALAFASLVVGESSTMASEAACLGTHAVFISKSGRGVNDEQEERYGLVQNFNGGSEREALQYIEKIASMSIDKLSIDMQRRQAAMLRETIDLTDYMIRYSLNLDEEQLKAAA